MTGVPELDPVLHFPKRLMIMGILTSTSFASAAFFKDNLHLSDSDLSKQMKALHDAGYVSITKSGYGRGSSTDYSATRAGRKAYATYKKTLTSLLELSERVSLQGDTSPTP
ncbi:transcriptional regulator [Trueperella pyogenes]|uniref:transcriptional regulator n=1 Tax=Trueperella pyogenes TaxID=1661 RepID=UPI0023DD74FC|nr:transcriptional regulator [Trueperella pyogenes]